jgi:Icc-related predicted phosphoesterase
MPVCFFVSDLHGCRERYGKLFAAIERERPAAVFLGGDLLPGNFGYAPVGDGEQDFATEYLPGSFRRLRESLGQAYPRVFLILGNDDPRAAEEAFLAADADGLWTCANERKIRFGTYTVCGYSFVPPTPFALKDWERYDVSRFVDPGAVSPEDGTRSVPASESETRYRTIRDDLAALVGDGNVARAVFLFHAPPYQTVLDRAALDGQMVDHAPLDVHVGSKAIRRFVEKRQPWVTLHGHVHESARLTGEWRERIGRTFVLGAAHDGPELALVRFDLDDPEHATRELL